MFGKADETLFLVFVYYLKRFTSLLYVTDLVFSTWIYGPRAKHKVDEGHELKWKKQGAEPFITDRENESGKMFITPLGSWIELEAYLEVKQSAH